MEKSLKRHLPGGVFGNVSPERSRAMGAVRAKGNKTTEYRLRLALVRAGISGWVMHPVGLPGKPDFYFRSSRLAVFVDGCFWHGCAKCSHGFKTRSSFWKAKINRTRERDAWTMTKLMNSGVRVLRLWEHELASDLATCVDRVQKKLSMRSGTKI